MISVDTFSRACPPLLLTPYHLSASIARKRSLASFARPLCPAKSSREPPWPNPFWPSDSTPAARRSGRRSSHWSGTGWWSSTTGVGRGCVRSPWRIFRKFARCAWPWRVLPHASLRSVGMPPTPGQSKKICGGRKRPRRSATCRISMWRCMNSLSCFPAIAG